jgi:hypothetical protein
MYALYFPLVSGISLASSFTETGSCCEALRQFLPLVIHMATICNSQVCLERASVYCSRRVLWHIEIVLMASLIIYICVGICGRAIRRGVVV